LICDGMAIYYSHKWKKTIALKYIIESVVKSPIAVLKIQNKEYEDLVSKGFLIIQFRQLNCSNLTGVISSQVTQP